MTPHRPQPEARRRLLALGLPFALTAGMAHLAGCSTPMRPPSPPPAPVGIRALPPLPPPAPGQPGAAPAPGTPAITTPGVPAPGPVVGQALPAAPAPPLAAEDRWLRDLFGGTPVQITTDLDGGVSMAVPLEFAFDTGASAIKPPLAALLDRLSASLRRQPRAQLRVAAPGDNGMPISLVQERIAAQRDYLLTRGVPYSRTLSEGRSRSDDVELRMTAPW